MQAFDNLLFDFGGVLFEVDYQRTEQAFFRLGLNKFDQLYTQLKQDRLFDDLEKGIITPAIFRDRLRSYSNRPLSDQQIDDAWNAILIGLPEKNILLLRRLKEKFRLFLLSNTNEIHEQAFRAMIEKQYGSFIPDLLFEKIYLSHRMHMRKPDPEIFRQVIADQQLDPLRTLFIDDSPQHVEGARAAGLQAHWLEPGTNILDFFAAMNL